jgi:hypothetical protein
MKTARVGVCLAFLLTGTFTSSLLAQSTTPPVTTRDDAPGNYDFFGPRNFQLRSDIGDGIGYSKGYQTFGAFQSMVVSPDEFIFFANPRGIVTYLGNLSANVGAGGRYYDENTDRILGGSFWYDHDNTGPKTYDQLGISLESLGKYLDFRVNGYMPTNDNRTILAQYLNGNNQFFSNFIGIGRSTLFTTPLKGGDFEVGGLLPGIGNVGIRPYVGGYYYQGEGTGAAYGVKARIEALITQDFWAQVGFSNDRLFGTNVTMALTWYYGSGQAPRWFQRIPVVDRLYQQVERNYRIAAYQELYNDLITATRSGGTGGSGGPIGTPIFVVHVDNSAASGGDGTVEHPLNQLPTHTGSNVDIVFVDRGTGTSAGYNHGITLNDYQRLLGQGVQHDFTSQQGTYSLPGYTPGPLPVLTNPAGNVVTLASHNEVSGFNIQNAGGHGIYGNGIVDFNINNVNIHNNLGGGIALVNATGNGQVFDSSLNNNALEGMRVDNTGGDLNLRVNNVDAQSNLTGVSLNGTGFANYNVIMNDLNASNSVRDGVDVALTANSTITGTFDNINSSNNNRQGGDATYGDGLRVTADNSQVNLTVQHSELDGNLLNGASFIGTNGSLMNVNLVDNGNSINGNQLNGVFFDVTNTTANLLLQNNDIDGNNGFGVYARATNGTFNLVAENNRITNNSGAGLAYTLRDAATGTVNIQENVITGTLEATAAQDNTIYKGQAIDIRLTGSTISSNATAFLTNGIIDKNLIGSLTTPVSANAGGGIFVYADQYTAIQNLTIGNIDGTPGNGNQIGYNGGDGIRFVRRNAATVDNVTISDNAVEHNNGDGISITNAAAPGNIPTPPPSNINNYNIASNILTNNAGNGLYFMQEADGQTSANVFGNLIDKNGANGIRLQERASSPLDARYLTGTWQQNTITNNNGTGIELDGRVQSLMIGSTGTEDDGNLITNNTQNGIQLNGSGSMTVGFNTISHNLTGGIMIHPGIGDGTTVAPQVGAYDNADNTNVTITHNTIDRNGNPAGADPNNIIGDGIEILSQGAGNAQMGVGAIGTTTVVANYNYITNNAGRGVDILNKTGERYAGSAPPGQGTTTVDVISSLANVTLDHNVISGNKYEAVYVVNTTASQQNQTDNSSSLLQISSGDVHAGSNPRLFFTMTNNTIVGNGTSSTFTASGLLIRVGTSGGGYFYNDDGGFFSEGRGGVGATVQNNTFHGNKGDDIFFDSFTSTADPSASDGTWSATEFTVKHFFGDPLSRLDLVFTGNTFDSAAVNNAGSPNPGSTAHVAGDNNPYDGAYYNNGEGTFKSRTTSDAPDTGIFTSATRGRNATRLAARFTFDPQVPTPPPPNGGFDSGDFLYPGLGQSTFRLLGVPAPGNVGVYTGNNVGTFKNGGFLIDNYYTGVGSQNGVGLNVVLPPGNGVGSPYGWNINGGDPRPQ